MTDIIRPLEVIEAEIKFFGAQSAIGIIETGKRLKEAKAQLPHGEWGKWLERVEISQEIARRSMTIAEEYGNSNAGRNLGFSKMWIMLDVPAEERQVFIEQSHEVNGQSKTVDEMTTRELQQAIKDRKAAEKEVARLEEENKRLKNQPKPEPITIEKTVEIIPKDYEQLKHMVCSLTESEKKMREKATEAENTAKAYKQYAESVKANGKEIDRISLKDFKFAIRAFMREVTPLVYLGEQFKTIKDRDKEEFYSEIETIERWISDVKQALEGNSGGANLIIVEGGK